MAIVKSLQKEENVGRAFSKQSVNYDRDDSQNIVLLDMRKQVFDQVEKFIKSKGSILELNAGTGIDALHFVQHGHQVHATDLSDGMLFQIKEKIRIHQLQNKFTCQHLSYDQLDQLNGNKFDFVFSNFGGLNCIDDLSKVTKHLPAILNPGGYVTWVIMPPVCLWELFGIFKGHGKKAFRRFSKGGVIAHVEGEYFRTYYFTLSQIKKAFGSRFQFISSNGLCAISPPPSKVNFPIKYPALYKNLRKIDSILRSHYPFNRWADHIIVTVKFTG